MDLGARIFNVSVCEYLATYLHHSTLGLYIFFLEKQAL